MYGYNTRGDVESASTAAGDTSATYGYTAYGKDDAAEFTGLDKPNPADPAKDAYNPYRFNAKRWDVSSSAYDMGFRDYNPELNRFTTRDMYTGALADMRLGTDMMTGNRYAFTSGNPVSRVERDGHEPDCMDYNSFTCPRMDTGTSISGPGEWGNAWMMDSGSGSSAESDAQPVSGSGEFGNAWQYNNTLPGASEGWTPPKEIPAWENFLGGLFDRAMGGGAPGESFLRDTTGYGTSKFLCFNVDAGMVWGYAGSGCLGSMRTEGGFDLAWVGAEGPELTTLGATASLTAGYSNADDWNQVRGSGLNLDGTYLIFTGGYSQAVNATTNCMEDGSSLPLTSVVRNSGDDPVGTFSFGVSTPGADVGGSLTCTGVH